MFGRWQLRYRRAGLLGRCHLGVAGRRGLSCLACLLVTMVFSSSGRIVVVNDSERDLLIAWNHRSRRRIQCSLSATDMLLTLGRSWRHGRQARLQSTLSKRETSRRNHSEPRRRCEGCEPSPPSPNERAAHSTTREPCRSANRWVLQMCPLVAHASRGARLRTVDDRLLRVRCDLHLAELPRLCVHRYATNTGRRCRDRASPGVRPRPAMRRSGEPARRLGRSDDFWSDDSARLPKNTVFCVPSHRRYSVPPLAERCLADLAKAADN